jgi:hypothetical protein
MCSLVGCTLWLLLWLRPTTQPEYSAVPFFNELRNEPPGKKDEPRNDCSRNSPSESRPGKILEILSNDVLPAGHDVEHLSFDSRKPKCHLRAKRGQDKLSRCPARGGTLAGHFQAPTVEAPTVKDIHTAALYASRFCLFVPIVLRLPRIEQRYARPPPDDLV